MGTALVPAGQYQAHQPSREGEVPLLPGRESREPTQ